MASESKISQKVGAVGSIAPSFHEGSRSEYLAQFVFSSFGTSIPVPHQEDSGIDLYCTLLERVGHRAWPRAYYSVQVKSDLERWVFSDPESVRWIIEHPLPIFLCVIQKREARIIVYHTTPRFAVWSLPEHPPRLELIPGTATSANTVKWGAGDTFKLEAPILNFTMEDLLKDGFPAQVRNVLKFWIDYDVENLVRIRSGIQYFWAPADYHTNETNLDGWTRQGGGVSLRDESLRLAQSRLRELLGLVSTYHYGKKDIVNAAIYAMALRQLCPTGYTEPDFPHDPGDCHDHFLHDELNRLFRMEPPKYAFQACDSLLKMVKDELLRHGIANPVVPPKPK